MIRARVAPAALLALLAGCTSGPDYRPPALADGAASGAPPLLAAQGPAFAPAPLPPHWWRLFADPTLDALVEKALVRNTDLRAALASLQQAQAQLREAERQRTPSTSLSINPTYGQASGDENGSPTALSPGPVYDGGFTVSYDFDLFGRLKRGIEAQQANVGAAQAALDLSRVNIAAQTTSAYVSACAAGLRIAVTNQSVAIARASLDVTQRRFDAGVAGANDVVRARTLLRQTSANLPALVADRQTALFQLATLTGDAPEAIPAAAASCIRPPVLRRPIPVGDGATLLARRPDVREAERSLHAAVAQIGVVTADLYPSITLGGSIGTTATSLGDIVRDRAFRWSVGPLLSWTVPNQSIVRAQIDQAGAAARQSLAQFDGTVLTALRETESALTTLARQLDTERELTLARDDAALAERNVARMYAGGVADFLDTLDAQRTLIQAQDSLAQATVQVSRDQVSLFMALGGGWEDAPPVADTDLGRVTTPHVRGRR